MKVNFLSLLLMPMPTKVKAFVWNLNSKNNVHPTAKIGLAYIDAERIIIGKNASVGHLNIIRGVETFQLGEGSGMGLSNVVKGIPLSDKTHFKEERDRDPSFIVGDNCGIGKSNYFDVCNRIQIGDFSNLHGFRVSFFTHGIDPVNSKQVSAPITIGRYCAVGLCSIFLKGSKLPDCSFLGANSTLNKAFTESHGLYSGVPAKRVKDLGEDFGFFHRKSRFIH